MMLRLWTAPSFALVALVLAASCRDPNRAAAPTRGVAGSAGSGETTGRGGSSAAGASGTSGVAGAAGSAPGGVSGASGGNANGGTGGDGSGRGGTGGSSGGASGGGQRGGAGGSANGGVAASASGGSAVVDRWRERWLGRAAPPAARAAARRRRRRTTCRRPAATPTRARMSAPFLTVTKARDVVRTVNSQHDARTSTCISAAATTPSPSTIAFGPQDSGTNGHRILYQAYPGETPVLNGATKVTGWTVSSGNVYKAALAPLDEAAESLRQRRARGR